MWDMAAAVHVERVRSIEIDPETEIVCIKLKSNGETVCIQLHLRDYEPGLEMGQRAVAEHRARKKVVRLRHR
jgi:hypothetical protein